MNKKTQKQRVYDRLMELGYITRNECLNVYISRLGAIIKQLKIEGLEITGRYKKSGNSSDYVYKLLDHPANQKPSKEDLYKTIVAHCTKCKERIPFSDTEYMCEKCK